MSIKESILKEGLQYEGNNFEENYFFSNLAKGFIADYKLFGEETSSMYSEIFGEEYEPIFENMQENIYILQEATLSNQTLLFEEQAKKAFYKELEYDIKLNKALDDSKKMQNIIANNEKAMNNAALNNVSIGIRPGSYIDKDIMAATAPAKFSPLPPEVKTGFLAGIWNKIKTFGASLAQQFPKLSGFLSKGIGWITANPMAVVGVAGGALLLRKIIKMLKNKGANTQVAKLQAAVDKESKK